MVRKWCGFILATRKDSCGSVGLYSPSPETLESISKVVEVPVPVIHFMSLSDEDIPQDKKQLYKMLSPMMDKYLSELFSIEI